MARVISQTRSIDALPIHIREQVIEKLLAKVSTRKVSLWLIDQGFILSFNAIARYRREKISKQLAIVAKLRQIDNLSENPSLKSASDADLTNAIKAADPIMERVNAKYKRYDQFYSQTLDPQGFSAIDRAETQALTLHANLTGRLQDKPQNMTVQIVIGGNSAPQKTSVERETDIPGETIEIAPG